MQKSTRLYRNDMYLKAAACKILDIVEDKIILDKTPFYPEGGGQPCDLGTIGEYQVVHVSEKEDVVYHQIDLSVMPLTYTIGTEVECAIDWDRRFDHMQNHCGEHILSGIFHKTYGGVNRGFRLGNDQVTIDIDFRGTRSEGLKAEDLDRRQIELDANKVIWSDAPVTIGYYDKKSDADHLPLRKELAVEENISIVCVGDEKDPADCCACCGTHPSTAGQVGQIKVLKLENNKGMVRVYFKCGMRALGDYGFKHNIVTEIKSKYSVKEEDILDLLNARDEKAAAVRKELKDLKKSTSLGGINERTHLAGEANGTLRSMLNNADRV